MQRSAARERGELVEDDRSDPDECDSPFMPRPPKRAKSEAQRRAKIDNFDKGYAAAFGCIFLVVKIALVVAGGSL